MRNLFCLPIRTVKSIVKTCQKLSMEEKQELAFILMEETNFEPIMKSSRSLLGPTMSKKSVSTESNLLNSTQNMYVECMECQQRLKYTEEFGKYNNSSSEDEKTNTEVRSDAVENVFIHVYDNLDECKEDVNTYECYPSSLNVIKNVNEINSLKFESSTPVDNFLDKNNSCSSFIDSSFSHLPIVSNNENCFCAEYFNTEEDDQWKSIVNYDFTGAQNQINELFRNHPDTPGHVSQFINSSPLSSDPNYLIKAPIMPLNQPVCSLDSNKHFNLKENTSIRFNSLKLSSDSGLILDSESNYDPSEDCFTTVTCDVMSSVIDHPKNMQNIQSSHPFSPNPTDTNSVISQDWSALNNSPRTYNVDQKCKSDLNAKLSSIKNAELKESSDSNIISLHLPLEHKLTKSSGDCYLQLVDNTIRSKSSISTFDAYKSFTEDILAEETRTSPIDIDKRINSLKRENFRKPRLTRTRHLN